MALERELRPLKAISDNYPKYLIVTAGFSLNLDGIQRLSLTDWLLIADRGLLWAEFATG
ncbi:MAG: hypothetical protein LBH11_05540 [Propionibacteriaceae bacterium]|jgi:hypothetical protein|nr:hypothetical protein [Propionibacteriaceae bacterium]